MDEPLPNPPPELKSALPFVQRANELRTADPVIAYWCCYYAAQLGIASNPSSSDAKTYLLTLMDTLESLKSKLADNDAVTNDAASSAYVENFALKVFVGADNEDRAGKATRATPRKFLAASQFIELLKIFGTLEPEMQEKVKYAKWKAADIAKAFKEGRRPMAGPPGGDAKEEEARLESAMGPGADSKEEQEYLAREMAKLTTAAPPDDVAPSTTRETSSTSTHNPVQQPPADDLLDSASLDNEEMWKSNPSTVAIDNSAPRRDSLDRAPLPHSTSFGSSPGSRPLPTPPQRDVPPISAHERMLGTSPRLEAGGPGAAPASFWGATAPTADLEADTNALPSVPMDKLPSSSSGGGLSIGGSGHPAIERIDPPRSPAPPSLPTTPGTLGGAFIPPPTAPTAPATQPFAPAPPTHPIAPATQQAPPRPALASAALAPSAPAIAQAQVYPETLDAKLSSRVQKLAKGAASAVDFEDLETARIQLRQALDILEGRVSR